MKQVVDLKNNTTKLLLAAIAGASFTVSSVFGSVPDFVWGGMAVIITVLVMAYILGLRQPTEEEMFDLVREALASSLDEHSEVIVIQDEEE